MHSRCKTKTGRWSHLYFGKGIKVCSRWSDFRKFLSDMGEPPTSKHTLDRIDNDKNYTPGNCRWATPAQQGTNTRRNRRIEYKGKTRCLSEWCKILDVPVLRVTNRMQRGWTFAEAVELKRGEHVVNHRH